MGVFVFFVFLTKPDPKKNQNLCSKIILFIDIVVLQWARSHHVDMLIEEIYFTHLR